MEQDLQQPLEVQLGSERIPEATYGGLQATTLVLDEPQAPLGLIDAPCTVAANSQSSEHQRQHEQDRGVGLASRDCREQAHRRKASVHHPDKTHDPDQRREIANDSREPHARDRADEIHDAARGQRQPRESGDR